MTTPYVTGTVSVTAGSPIVTGVGTGWLTSGLVAGQFGLDSANGNPVPVLFIDSDTQITLAKPWRGTSASAQAYWITYDTTPGQQTVANAQRLAEYIARLDKPALAALASLVPAADKLPYFGPGGAGALADFNAAARALLAGGQLPNAQVRNDLTPDKAFRRGNVLGTVSQSAGVPTGAIIERGSNANGQYVRFADGTQICFGFFVGYTADAIKTIPLAASFATPVNSATYSVLPAGGLDNLSIPAWCDDGTNFKFVSGSTFAANRVDFTVIGRWY